MKKINLKVNGRPGQVVVDPKLALIDLLRDVYSLTSVKQSLRSQGAMRSMHGHRKREGRALVSGQKRATWKGPT